MTQKILNLEIYTDGGSRGNPGPAAIGVFAKESALCSDHGTKVLFQLSHYIGEATNNVAEWKAVIQALEHLVKNNITPIQINFYLDSELVVKQIKGEYKIKQPHLQPLSVNVHQLLQQLNPTQIFFHHIPREQNKVADFLVNQALDNLSK